MNYWSKYLLKKLIHFTPQYYRYRKGIRRNTGFNQSDVYNVIKDVPYYIDKGYCNTQFENYPILRKKDISGNENLFISTKIHKRFLIKVHTSGSSGISINFWKTIREIIKEEAYNNYEFSLIGKKLRIAVLRGNKPTSGKYEYKHKHLLLSSYHLSKQTVLEYLQLIEKYKINCLHVYPSAIHIFCKYLKEILEEQDIKLPNLKGIFSSSEILTAETKNIILQLFPDLILVDRYGSSEQVAMAIALNNGFFHFYNSYGIVEFLDTGLINGENKIKEIIGTSISNKGMPLVRYGTADYVEIDEDNNIVSIIGRTSDFVVNRNKEIVPCIVVTRHKTLDNVITFQYYQDTIGELLVRARVNDKFKDDERKIISEDIGGCFHGLMNVQVEVVKGFETTKNGKHIRCIQKLDLKNIK